MRAEALRQLFGLPASEELYGTFMCAHTRPRWGAQFLQGQLYVFSTSIIFHANLSAKVVRIEFKNVRVVRKRCFLRLPNTIAVGRVDEAGRWHDDVLTSFVFSERRRCFDTLVARWRHVNPRAAEAHLGLLSEEGRSTPAAAVARGQYRRASLQLQPERPFPCELSQACVPPGTPLPPEPQGVAGGSMLQVVSRVLPCDASTLAHVLLSDMSGFLPAVMEAQGNKLLSITPWQVVPREAPGAGACLSRTFTYHHSESGSWGPVSSRVVQRHLLSFGAQGSSLLLEVSQTMPDLPAGVGKALQVLMRWEVRPFSDSSSSSSQVLSGAAAAVAVTGAAAASIGVSPVASAAPPAAAEAGARGSKQSSPFSTASSKSAGQPPQQQQQTDESGYDGEEDAATLETASSSSCTARQPGPRSNRVRSSLAASMRGARKTFRELRAAASSPLADFMRGVSASSSGAPLARAAGAAAGSSQGSSTEQRATATATASDSSSGSSSSGGQQPPATSSRAAAAADTTTASSSRDVDAVRDQDEQPGTASKQAGAAPSPTVQIVAAPADSSNGGTPGSADADDALPVSPTAALLRGLARMSPVTPRSRQQGGSGSKTGSSAALGQEAQQEGQQQQEHDGSGDATAAPAGAAASSAGSSSGGGAAQLPRGDAPPGAGCAQAGQSAACSVQWRISAGVVWTKWLPMQTRITADTLSSIAPSLTQLADTGAAWLDDPQQRLSLAAVMPAHTLKARRNSSVLLRSHRRSGSAGSVARLASVSPLQPLGGVRGAGQLPAAVGAGGVSRLLAALAACAGTVAGGCRRAAHAAYQQRAALLGLLVLAVLLLHTLLLWRVMQLLQRVADQVQAAPRGAGRLSPAT